MSIIAALVAFALGASCGDGGGGLLAALGGDPAFETDAETLAASLDCTDFTHPEHEPVLLVHGTFTYGQEQWSWNYVPYLQGLGYDVCTVTYPQRGLGDQQVSAEYVAHALQAVRERTGRKVDMVGHSQGGSMPRWAIKWWPSARAALDDLVMLAAPNHGTIVAGSAASGGPPRPPSSFQFPPDSQFTTTLNRGDETPGSISYTSIYTLFDELVQPVIPVATAALEVGLDNPNVANILIQDVCPGRFVDHLTIGLTDSAVAALTVDALSRPGPADVERAGGSSLCLGTSIVDPALAAQKFTELGPTFAGSIPSDVEYVTSEPPLKPYAR